MQIITYKKIENNEYDYAIKFNRTRRTIKFFNEFAQILAHPSKKTYDAQNKCWLVTSTCFEEFEALDKKIFPNKNNKLKNIIKISSEDFNVVQDFTNIGHMMKLQPFDYQKKAIKLALDKQNAIIIGGCGCGKTPIGIGIYLEARLQNIVSNQGMIVAKASLKKQWLMEIKKFSNLKAQIVYTRAESISIKKSIIRNKNKLLKKELDIEKIISEKEESIKNQDFEKAANLRDNEKQLKEEFEKIKNEWRAHSCTEVQIVDEDDIAKVVSIWTKVPVEKLTEKESVKLLHLEDTLRQRVVGQDEAIKALTRAVKRARVGLKNPNRPIGTFIFCGPTGVGKTELCNVLAEVMFGKISNLIRIDMSEYMEKHSVSRLIGAPPGYVGYEEGGQLSEAVRRKPYSVVLLDEIEKAHPDVFNILLQIMEDGRLTDGKGKTVDFKNTIVIMTSNVGAQKLKSQRKVGFDTNSNLKEAEYEKMKDVVLGELKNAFKPEFLNRVDDIIVFNQLKEEDTLQIVNIMLKDTISR